MATINKTSNFLIRKPSQIHGFGIFTNRGIFKGEKFYQVENGIISNKPLPKYARVNNKYIFDKNVLCWVNHSCQPNTELELPSDQPTFVALEDIKPGDEITVDYEKTEEKNMTKECNCQTSNCRHKFFFC